jgi:hypothetical protein
MPLLNKPCLTLKYARQQFDQSGCPITEDALECRATYAFEQKYSKRLLTGMLLISMAGWLSHRRVVHWLIEASLGVVICALLVVYVCYKQMATARDAIPGSSIFKLAGAYMVSRSNQHTQYTHVQLALC